MAVFHYLQPQEMDFQTQKVHTASYCSSEPRDSWMQENYKQCSVEARAEIGKCIYLSLWWVHSSSHIFEGAGSARKWEYSMYRIVCSDHWSVKAAGICGANVKLGICTKMLPGRKRCLCEHDYRQWEIPRVTVCYSDVEGCDILIHICTPARILFSMYKNWICRWPTRSTRVPIYMYDWHAALKE